MISFVWLCRNSSWIDPVTTTTTTTTTLSPYYPHRVDGSSEDSNTQARLSCEMVKTLGVELIPGLTYSLLTYLSLIVLVTVFSSVIGCCLQECIHDEVRDLLTSRLCTYIICASNQSDDKFTCWINQLMSKQFTCILLKSSTYSHMKEQISPNYAHFLIWLVS